jgi:hypothetical protein
LTTPYTAGTFNLHTAAFDALLPRVPLIDYISLRDVFYGTLPKAFRDKLLDQAQAQQIEGCTYQNLKDIGRELWKNGYRPAAAALSAGPSKPSAPSSRFQSYLIQAKKVNTQNWSAEEKKQYYSTFKCFHCHQVGHISPHCPKRNEKTNLMDKLTSDNRKLQVKVAKLQKQPAGSSQAKVTPPPPDSEDSLDLSGSERYATQSSNRIATSSDLELMVHSLNKRIPTSLRLLPNHVRMDLAKQELAAQMHSSSKA